MAESRVTNSVRNIFAAWGGQAVSAVLSFFVRAVFVATLASEFVGLETLFSSLLTILSLADLGIGSAIVYALYDPLASKDVDRLKTLMRLFKRAYIIIGVVIIGIGAAMTPFVYQLVGDAGAGIPNLQLYFFCFVLNTGVSYFFSYKGALVTADQKGYVVYLITYAFQIAMACFQMAALFLTGNYLVYLLLMITSTVLTNAFIAHKANKMYPFMLEKDVQPIDKPTLRSIQKNVVGLMMHKVAGVASTPVNNLIITLCVGLSTTSLYGNYLLVVNALDRIIAKLFDSIVASVGNLNAQESEERQYEVFQTTFFVNALVYGCATGGMLLAFNSFVSLWIGPDWCFSPIIVALIALLFYVKGMRCACMAFTSAYGLYWYTRWKAVLEAISLPLLALLLVGPLGISGVLIASMISSLCISTVYEAWAVYRHGFHRHLRKYVLRFALYAAVTLVPLLAAYALCEMWMLPYLLGFVVKGALGVAIPALALTLVFGRTREAKETFSLIRRVFGKAFGKLKRSKA